MNYLAGFFGTMLVLLTMVPPPSCAGPQDSQAVSHQRKTAAKPRGGTKSALTVIVTMIPSNVKIDDTTKQGTRLAKVTARWSNGTPYAGDLKLTKNPGGICQLVGTEMRLGRDATKADDYTTSVCTVTAIEKEE